MTAGSGSRARPSDTIEVRREGLSLKPKRAPSRAPAVSRNAESMVRAVSGNSRSAVISGPRSESASTVRSSRRKLFFCTDTRRDSERRSEEHTSELQSRGHLVCRLLLEKKKKYQRATS